MFNSLKGYDIAFTEAYQDETTRHQYRVLRLWEQDSAIFLSNPGLFPLASLTQTNSPQGLLTQVAIRVTKIADKERTFSIPHLPIHYSLFHPPLSSMRQSLYLKNRQLLQQLMQQAGISSLSQLSQLSGVSQWQLIRLQYGLMPKMQLETLLKLSQTLQVPINQLLTQFCPESLLPGFWKQQQEESVAIGTLKQEYQRLQQQLKQQRETLNQEFQQSSLQALESWLLQWPTAAKAAQNNPELSATKLLPLTKPVTDLLKQWGVEAIAAVGEELPYDPQWHQLMEGTAEPGEPVKVRYIGYRQGDKLLYRAKVSPVERGSRGVEE